MRASFVVALVFVVGCPRGPEPTEPDSGQPSVCPTLEVPAVVDFGAVARGDTYEPTFTIANRGPGDAQLSLGDIVTASDPAFAYAPGSPRGSLALDAGTATVVSLSFAPTAPRDYFATITAGAAGCPDAHLRLIGTGVDQVLSWTPATVDFGYATPGLAVEGEVTFANVGFKPVALTAMGAFEGTAASVVYAVIATDTADLTRLTVPGATRYDNAANPNDPQNGKLVPGTATVRLSFTPAVVGPKTAMLRASSDVKNQASLGVPLRGFGGGPDIDVWPSPVLNVGRIAYFAGQGSFATRKLTISNVGTRPSPPDPMANLKLGAGGLGAPSWTVVPKNAISSATELCVGVFDTVNHVCTNLLPAPGSPGGYDPAIGLEASGTSATIDVPVRVTPDGVGQKEWELTIFSNDPDEPAVTLTVQANAVNLPPCQYSATPLTLSFGTITSTARDLGFQVRNLSSNPGDLCLITNVELKAGSSAAFSLPAGPVGEQELGPGDTLNVLVRASPLAQRPATLTAVQGQVLFNASNPTQPERAITLEATSAP